LSLSCVVCAQCCLCLWIALVMCLEYPMLSVSLDCLSHVCCVPNVVCVFGLRLRQSRDTDNIGYSRHMTKAIQRHRQHWAHTTQDKDNPETQTTLGAQDTGLRQSRDTDNIGHTQDTGLRQSRDTDNIGHTRHRTKTIQRHRQHWEHKTQDKDNPETHTTWGTHDTEQRQSRDTDTIGDTQDTGQRQSRDTDNIGHTQDTGLRQSRDTDNIGHTRHRTKTIQRQRQHWAHKTQD
jgi:hypothetical protein